MKKILSIMLILATLLSLASCQGLEEASSETATTTAAPVSTADSSEDETVELPTVPNPLTWDDINAIPIADDSMSEEALRQIVVDFFRLQQTFRWTPNEDLKYIITTYGTINNFEVGWICEGLPYVSNARGNLYILMDYYDPETGVLDVKSIGANNLANIIGNQCSYGSFWGWARVSNTYRATLTKTIVAKNGAIPVGPYTYDTSIDKWSKAYSTRKVCQTNGAQVMFQSYANMKIGDGMVFCNTDSGGHVQMVSGAPVVVRKNGKIDGDESYLLYIDQGSSISVLEDNGTTIHRQAEVDVKMSFSDMYKTGYVPFTVSELQGDTVEKATYQLEAGGDLGTLSGICASRLTCNYAISNLTLTLYDGNGAEVRSYRHIPTPLGTMEIPLSTAFKESIIKRFIKDGYTVKVSCRVGTGEQFTITEGPIRL